jgi:hypothetical protein
MPPTTHPSHPLQPPHLAHPCRCAPLSSRSAPPTAFSTPSRFGAVAAATAAPATTTSRSLGSSRAVSRTAKRSSMKVGDVGSGR